MEGDRTEMITIDGLKEFGADADTALKRCMNNEDFYLKQVNKALKDTSFERLKECIGANDLDGAFEMAHALKGVWANLGLTPLCEPVAEMTEHLRKKTDRDYSGYIDMMDIQLGALRNMQENES